MYVAYCPACRVDFYFAEPPPPYSVVHVSPDHHVHPITRERPLVLLPGIEVVS